MYHVLKHKYLERGKELIAKKKDNFYAFTETASSVHDTVNGVMDSEERYQH